MTQDEIFVSRAMDLALNGLGAVSPNPLVGCVIVKNNVVISEAWHSEFGKAHAEVKAIEQIVDKSTLSDCSIYLNLEPCSHAGKTPPCVDLLVSHNVSRVVISNKDPNPKVDGSGIRRLRDANINIEVGVLQSRGEKINQRFFTNHAKGRPHIILKWAQTKDGFIANSNGDSKWISGIESRTLVHKWRHQEDAILVGRNTVMNDDPKLNVRLWKGHDPLRVVLDPQLRLSQKYNVFKGPQKSIFYNLKTNELNKSISKVKVSEENFLAEMLQDLINNDIGSILVEGGSKTLQAFIEANLWDEARVFVGRNVFENGMEAPQLRMEQREERGVGKDKLLYFCNPNSRSLK